MGQKVNPHGLRVGVIDKWNSQWYAGKQEFASFILEDHKIRKHIVRTDRLPTCSRCARHWQPPS